MGCKVNQYESEKILDSLICLGFDETDNMLTADVVIFNKCTVTSESDRKVLNIINKIKNFNKTCILAVIGCYSEIFSDKITSANKSAGSIFQSVCSSTKLNHFVGIYCNTPSSG